MGLRIQVSVEAGGYLCPGKAAANDTLAQLSHYLAAGGRIDRFMLESIFSRTMTGPKCKSMHPAWTFADVAEQAAEYLEALLPAIEKASGKPVTIGLIDALPHFAAGPYHCDPTYQKDHGPEGLGQIGDAISALKGAIKTRLGRDLEVYWADCPLDYSLHMPNGTGFDKVVYTLQKVLPPIGVKSGKIFNTQSGGATSDEAFCAGTMQDVQGVRAAAARAGASAEHLLDEADFETWYDYPLHIVPESRPASMTWTAKHGAGLLVNGTGGTCSASMGGSV